MSGLSGQCLFMGVHMCIQEVPQEQGFKAFRKAQVLLGSSRSWMFVAAVLWSVLPQNISCAATALWL